MDDTTPSVSAPISPKLENIEVIIPKNNDLNQPMTLEEAEKLKRSLARGIQT